MKGRQRVRLVRVVVRLHPATIELANDLARLRERPRSEVIRDAIAYGLGKDYAWLERARARERRQEFQAAELARQLEVIRRAFPERFDR